MHAFDRRTDGRTDGQTEFPSLYRDCIPCSAVKIDGKTSVTEDDDDNDDDDDDNDDLFQE